MSDATTIVVGAGYVGRRVIDELAVPGTIELDRTASLDLDTDDALPVALPASYCVLYTVPPSIDHEEDVRLVKLLGMLEPAPERFVYISTSGVYGDCGGALVDETAAVRPTTARAKRRVQAEHCLQEWATGENVRLYILRVPGIYGPGRLGLERIRNLLPIVRESEAYPGNRIHVTDLVSCCIAALCGGAAGGIYNVGDGDHRSSTWFSREVARQAGLPASPETGHEGATRRSDDSRRVATSRMREQLGVTPHYANAEDGIRASLL